MGAESEFLRGSETLHQLENLPESEENQGKAKGKLSQLQHYSEKESRKPYPRETGHFSQRERKGKTLPEREYYPNHMFASHPKNVSLQIPSPPKTATCNFLTSYVSFIANLWASLWQLLYFFALRKNVVII